MLKKILLVDDESSLRRTMTLGLSQAGYETDPCENGITALKKLETYSRNNTPLDGIVVDVHLPDINGLKLVKIMKAKYPTMPIILITGFADRYNLEEIKNLDVTALLEKPFTPDELVDQFVNIMKDKAAADKLAAEGQEAAGVSAYVLVKVDEKNGFVDTYQKLHVMEHIVYCDATKGDYDIILMVQAANRDKIRDIVEKQIKQLATVLSAEILDVENPVLDESTASIIKDAEHILGYYEAVSSKDVEGDVCAYLLMEVDKERQQDIYLAMRLMENLVFCDYSCGKYNLTSMVKAANFADIDRLIGDRINPLSGVIKVKKYPIIKIFEM